MRGKITTWLAWIWSAIFLTAVIWVMLDRSVSVGDDGWQLLGALLWGLTLIIFTFVGALIVSRQPRNTVGWLLMISPVFFALNGLTSIYVESFETIPVEPSTLFLVVAWLNNILYLPMLFSAMFILQLFPSGRLLSPRWRWLFALGLGLAVIGTILSTLFETEIPLGDAGTIPNPIGGTLPDALLPAYNTAGGVLFVVFIFGSVASLFIRYRRAGPVERNQIKWLLFACSLFAGVLAMSSLLSADWQLVSNLLEAAFVVSFAAIPVAIAIAILRYNLWDINVIIRKTAVYAVLTALLALVYFGVIVLLQSIFEAVSGQQSAFSIVISTLVIAALFSPLRRRVQDMIDRRFYRNRYDAERTLADFGQFVRDETDLTALTAELLRVTEETMQPEQVTLWLNLAIDERKRPLSAPERLR